jgi:hypothetical protein
MNVRIETKGRGGFDQPIVVVHPDQEEARELAVTICDALFERRRIVCRATIGDNPPESGKWGEGEVVYSRGC